MNQNCMHHLHSQLVNRKYPSTSVSKLHPSGACCAEAVKGFSTAGFNHAVQKSYTFPLSIKLTFSTFYSLSLAMTQYGWAIYWYYIHESIYSLKCRHYLVPSKTLTMELSRVSPTCTLPCVVNPVSSFANNLQTFSLQSQRSKKP